MKYSYSVKFNSSLLVILLFAQLLPAEPISLFDGNSFSGWEGNTNDVWRIENGVIVGGSMEGNPLNEFLTTKKAYENFRLKLDYKLEGTEGFVNGGVQIRSRRTDDPPNEMIGYQADIGAGYSGFLYDESRRRTMLAVADTNLIQRIEKVGNWNTYEILARGKEVKLTLNGHHTVTWVETDDSIRQEGVIGLQIHGNCKAVISFRNITIEELPSSEIPTEGKVMSRFGHGQPRFPTEPFSKGDFELRTNEVVVLVGGENFVREQAAAELESRLAVGFADKTPRFRSMAWEADTVYEQWRDLNFGDWLAQLRTAEAGVVIAQFGQMEAFDGIERIAEFETAYHRLLDQFAGQTRRLILVSPMPFERPGASHAPDLADRNDDVAAYASAVRRVAEQRDAVYVDLFTAIYNRNPESTRLTADGIHLSDEGLKVVADIISQQLGVNTIPDVDLAAVQAAITEKNKLWFDSWRPANWSFAYGDRVSQMYGRASGGEPSLHGSFEERMAFINAADQRIHALAQGESAQPLIKRDRAIASEVPKALTPEEQLATFETTDGFAVNLFASERDGVVDPVQFSWDEQGRLYVACSPSYPQSMASEEPGDYIVVLEDTDHDGRADKSWNYVEGLTMVQGVEPGNGGLYVCDFDKLLLIGDADGDGRADSRRVIFSGFGIGDTHQLINSISHGPDGSLWFTQGLHAMSLVETPWGIARLDRAGVWRLRPRTLRLEGYFGGGMAGANCWGVVSDDYGQVFHKTGDRPTGYWTVPGMVRGADPQGSGSREEANVSYRDSKQQYHSVGALFDSSPKTTSIDIVGTKAMPDELQGKVLIGGYFGSVVELHELLDDGAGFRSTQLPKLMRSSNKAFRPVDVSIGPDGAMYLADWYNPVIGHYQASYADPRRDRKHGRIWRITAKEHAPVKQPNLAEMSNDQLLNQLRSPERWTRYQAKRLLFYRPSNEVISAVDEWLAELDTNDYESEPLLIEVAGVFEAHETIRPELLDQLLAAKDYRVRAYGALMLGPWHGELEHPLATLRRAVRDEHPRVRLCAVVSASYFSQKGAALIASEVLNKDMDRFLTYALYQSARASELFWKPALLAGSFDSRSGKALDYLKELAASAPEPPSTGEELFQVACMTCHQPNGKGLPGVYPALAGSDWVSGDADRLIKIVLHGLNGPIEINGEKFVSATALEMPAMAGLTDQQIADVLSFVRDEFGEGASPISVDEVGQLRRAYADRQTPWLESDFR